MFLNYIWAAFIIIAFIVALIRLIFFHDTNVFSDIMNGTFTSAKTGFEISLGLTGALTLWMGLMKIGEKAGAINFLSRIIGPFFRKLFPEIPEGHPALGNIMMNFSANMLGLGNAATPLGLKAMQSMQELNPEKERASNSMIMFLVLNTAGLTLIPVSIMAIRAQKGAANPADVFIPIMVATYCASLIGMIAVAIRQKINLLDRILLAWILSGTAFIAAMMWGYTKLSAEQKIIVPNVAGSLILFTIIMCFILPALFKKQNIFESFIEGAKEGFNTAVRIIPYLIAMLVAIGMFRACGAMDYFFQGVTWALQQCGADTRFVPSLPIAMMKPLSGGGTQGLTVDAIVKYGPDSFVGRLSSVMYASADTTLYIVALYFGSVGIKNTRYAVGAGLIADLAGVVAAILLSYLFWG